jgi:transcription elongation factor Elf1
MKKKFYCPACGTRELTRLFITNHKGKSLSLHLSSQADIRKSSGDAYCTVCKHAWRIAEPPKTGRHDVSSGGIPAPEYA